MPEAEQGLNVARIASLRAGIPVSASAMTINRFCSSGLQAIALAAERIMVGAANVIVAGGTESMSLVPMGGHKIAPNPDARRQLSRRVPDDGPGRREPRARIGHHARRCRMRSRCGAISGRSPLSTPAASPTKLVAVGVRPQSEAQQVGVTPASYHDYMKGSTESGVRPQADAVVEDEGPRRDTSLEALAKLKPAFHVNGTVTAGNSSQTSDGASAVVVMSGDRARALGVAPLGRFVGFTTAGVEPERFGIGPGARDPEDSERHRADARSNRSRRAERGVCRAGARLPAGAAHRSRSPERQRRRDRARASARLHRRQADHDAALRDEASSTHDTGS